MTVVILCGGAGTRLWPLSRPEKPKQFAKLFDGPTLFEATVARNLPLADRFIIVTNAAHRELAMGQFQKVAGAGIDADFLLEPIGRNTAPAITLAALASRVGEILLVVPSDHAISDSEAYISAARLASEEAAQGNLVTFGIHPTGPDSGYGYIEATAKTEKERVFSVSSFREKPSREVAEGFLSTGRYFWNSGMFAFTRETILSELDLHASSTLRASRKALAEARMEPMPRGRIVALEVGCMASIPASSIDCAVMEKSDRVRLIPTSLGWSDLGSYDALYESWAKDKSGNASTLGTRLQESSGNLVISDGSRIALVGVDDLVVIQDGTDILVVHRGLTQLVKDLAPENRARNAGSIDQ